MLEIGDVVVLLSEVDQTPPVLMTVAAMRPDWERCYKAGVPLDSKQLVECCWFDAADELRREVFPNDVLRHA